MGNSLPTQQQNIKYVQTLEDENFGSIDIYKSPQGKYVMMLRRTFMKDNNGKFTNDFGFHEREFIKQEIYHTHSVLFSKNMQLSNNVENLCIVYETVDTYCEYFNFTFSHLIKCKKQMECEQFWLCFIWLLKFGIFMKQKGWQIQGGMSLNKFFITLEGQPTVSMHHVIKSKCYDVVTLKNKSQIEEIGMLMLQLSCLTYLDEKTNVELYLRKVEKIDMHLGKILANILRKSIKSTNQHTLHDVLFNIESLREQHKINVSQSIVLNKFKYSIPTEPKTVTEQSVKNQILHKPIVINSLQGKKNRQTMSLRDSSKRSDDLGESKMSLNRTPLQASFNKTLSMKGAILMDQIEGKKKQIERKREQLIERKEEILKNGMKYGSIKNKQNIFANSIREIRPSYSRKESWANKMSGLNLRESDKP